MTTPIDLFASFLHLRDGGHLHAGPRSFDHDGEGWQLMTFHVETDADAHADHWELHPEAEELVVCLTGGIRVYLRAQQPGDAEEQFTVPPGTATIVPRGRWHRIELDAPSDIMSVTMGRGSRLEQRTSD